MMTAFEEWTHWKPACQTTLEQNDWIKLWLPSNRVPVAPCLQRSGAESQSSSWIPIGRPVSSNSRGRRVSAVQLWRRTCLRMSRKRLLRFGRAQTAPAWASVFARRIKDSLSLPAFKRKQLRHELYPSPPHPPLGTGFLPLSRTDRFFFVFFFVQSRDVFIQSSAQPTSTPTTAAVPLPSLSFSFPLRMQEEFISTNRFYWERRRAPAFISLCVYSWWVH